MIETERLLLRQWREEDKEPFAKLNGDARVREFFPSILNKEESDHLFGLLSAHIEKYGWGMWAAELKSTGEFIGFIGIWEIPFTAHFTPAVEIGWRLAFEHWGKGYATEGALAALRYGFETLHLKEIVALTAVENRRSRNVMEKIGMKRNPADDFDHPNVPEGNKVRRQVLYRIRGKDGNYLC